MFEMDKNTSLIRKVLRFCYEKLLPTGVAGTRLGSAAGKNEFNVSRSFEVIDKAYFEKTKFKLSDTFFAQPVKLFLLLCVLMINWFTRVPGIYKLFKQNKTAQTKFGFHPNLNKKGKILYSIIMPLMILQGLIDSFNAYLFALSLLAFLINTGNWLYSKVTGNNYVEITPEVLAEYSWAIAISIGFAVSNFLYFFSFNVDRANTTANKIALGLQTPVKLDWATLKAWGISLLSLLAVPTLAFITMSASFAKLPHKIKLPKFIDYTLSSVAALTAFVNQYITFVHPLFDYFRAKPKPQPIIVENIPETRKEKISRIIFYISLLGNNFTNLLGNFTAVLQLLIKFPFLFRSETSPETIILAGAAALSTAKVYSDLDLKVFNEFMEEQKKKSQVLPSQMVNPVIIVTEEKEKKITTQGSEEQMGDRSQPVRIPGVVVESETSDIPSFVVSETSVLLPKVSRSMPAFFSRVPSQENVQLTPAQASILGSSY